MDVVVCGGSVIGLASAMLLARDGHHVTVLEVDDQEAPSPREAWEAWERKGVPQFRQPHNLFPRFQRIVDQELPHLTPRLREAGLASLNEPFRPPPFLDQAPRAGDERYQYLTGRRPVVEAAFADAAHESEGVTVRRGVRVLDYRYDGDRVVGVVTTAGEERCELVVDAMGRQSPTVELLAGRGLAPLVTAQDIGFAYYTRYFRGPEPPAARGPGLAAIGSFSLLTLYGDNDTWSATAFVTSADRPLKALRDPEVFTRVVRACPAHAHWVEGEPITGVLPMAGVLDRHRSFVVDGRPVVTGLVAGGDAWACTNPSAGRGLSVGLVHAQQLPRVVREHEGDPEGLVLAWDAATQEHVAPFFHHQVRADSFRIAEMTAHRDGTEPPVDEQGRRLQSAAMRDADVFRAMMEVAWCLSFPEQALGRPEVADKVSRLGSVDQPPPLGPDRRALLELVG